MHILAGLSEKIDEKSFSDYSNNDISNEEY